MSHVRPIRSTANTSAVAAAILATAVVPDGWARTTAGGTQTPTTRTECAYLVHGETCTFKPNG
jgi:hypothetical protein